MKNRKVGTNLSLLPMLLGTLLASLAAPCWERSACAQENAPTPTTLPPRAADEVVTTARRIDALPGSTVLLPLIPAGARLDPIHGPPEGWVPGAAPEVRMAGRTLDRAVHRLEGRLSPHAVPAQGERDGSGEWRGWLPQPRRWEATPRRRAGPIVRGADVSFWVLAVTLPERRVGREMEVGGRRVAVNWLTPPPDRTDVARLPLLEAPLEARRRLGDMLRREAIDPFRRWRCSIIADRFTPHALWGDRPALEPFDNPVLEAAAAHAEARARAAIESARRIDPDLAAAILSALTTVVRTPGGDLLPVWPSDETGTSELFASLLDPGKSPRERRADAEVWLGRIPDTIAWVVSDHAGSRADDHVATIGVANLTDREAICSAAPEGESATNARPILAHRAATLRTHIEPTRTEMAATVVARVGVAAQPLTVLTATPVAAPPGIELGPMLPDWTMVTWVGAAPTRVPASTAASGRLFAEMRQPGERDARRWRIFLEARRGQSDGREEIRIWCGPLGAAEGIIVVRSDGSAAIDAGAGAEPFEASVTQRADRWTALLDLPAWLIPDDGVLRLGVDRVDGSGGRWAWPRPMLPGQDEPGRLRIDLTGWSGLEGE